ncbi:ABC transporter substrate-binding protein [Microbispora sp. NEAU-D428]|uniref:ABC transporter substrate-binding protein n=1 Tax=Microbispora sitophila TaxID=2771537 RepID=UPI001868969E|nr:ABC transporter substrate-binding protein [Microbispora sitophila]MBE3012084.1 ABC transporter substrate-binding protein [Microbispora sitophila]
MSPRRKPLALALLALNGLLAACAAETGTNASSAGATLVVAMPADPACLDPQQTGQLVALDISRSLVDTLTDQDPRTGKIVPWLASEFSASDDARQFTFTLREGVTFSDGTPLDAEAVKASFDRLATLPANGAASYLRGYQGTTVVDAHRLHVDFDSPNAQFLQATSGAGLGILSPVTAGTPLADRCRGHFVGSGPYVLDHYTSNQEVVLKRRTGYSWPSSLATVRGEASLAEVRFVFVPEAGARTTALRSGQVQVAENVQPADQDSFAKDGFHLLVTRVPGLVPPLSLNHAGVLADQRVRQALLLAVDRADLVDTVLGPRFTPATGVLASITPLYVDQSDKLRYDPARAAELLDEAGWRPGPDGIRVKDGKPLTLNWLIPAPMPPVDEYVQQQLRKVGVDVKLNAVPPTKYVEQQQAGKFDITAVAVTRADPDVLRNIFYSKGSNLWHLPPSKLDDYLEQQAAATDEGKRREAVAKAAEWILDHADTVPLYENALVHGVSDAVKDLETDASTRLDLHDARLAS